LFLSFFSFFGWLFSLMFSITSLIYPWLLSVFFLTNFLFMAKVAIIHRKM
jgi:hypothetical protein